MVWRHNKGPKMHLIRSFAAIAAATPKKIALITEKNTLSFEDVLRLTHLFDLQLTARGVRPGQTVVMGTNQPEFNLILSLILSHRGLTVAFADAATALATGLQFDHLLTLEPSDLIPRDRQIVIEAAWFAALATAPLPDYTTSTGPGGSFMLQSSGSTGRPKLIRTAEAARLSQASADLFFDASDMPRRRFLTTLASGTGYGLNAMLSVLAAGGSVVALAQDQDKLLQYIDLYRVDTLAASPAIVERMLHIPHPEQYLGTLRDVRFLGAMASPALLATFARLCPATLHIGYGSGEMGRIFAATYDRTNPPPAGYVGRLTRPDLEVAFFDEALSPLPDATEGVVGFRSHSGQFDRAYLTDSMGDDRSGYHDTHFFPGDILRRDGEDFFVIGRLKNIVNAGGNKFALERVAEALTAVWPHATFVPIPQTDALGLERLALVYHAPKDIARDTLAHLIATQFHGLTLGTLLRVADLPLTRTGKIDIPALKALLPNAPTP